MPNFLYLKQDQQASCISRFITLFTVNRWCRSNTTLTFSWREMAELVPEPCLSPGFDPSPSHNGTLWGIIFRSCLSTTLISTHWTRYKHPPLLLDRLKQKYSTTKRKLFSIYFKLEVINKGRKKPQMPK